MHLNKVRIHDFRCLEYIDTELDPGINLLVGENGSGKSSFLETLFFLGRARSFRSGSLMHCIRNHMPVLSVFAQFQDRGGEGRVGIIYGAHKTRIKLNGASHIPLNQLAMTLPIHLVDPGIHRLTEDGPSGRRRFLDWGAFHVEQKFFPSWKTYKRGLMQRNKALKTQANGELENIWNQELTESGHRLDDCRRRQVDRLNSEFSRLCGRVLKEHEVSIQYNRGWPEDTSLEETLDAGIAGDRRAGYTRYGPHRADLELLLDGELVKLRASRGEQKAFNVLLSLAQVKSVADIVHEPPVLLVDDLAAELGHVLGDRLGTVLSDSGLQAFITTLGVDFIPQTMKIGKMFHVEHGGIRRMV